MKREALALQLYTIRDETTRDFARALRAVAAMGYPAVEFAGYGGLTREELSALLKETGLRAASTHIALPALQQDLDREIAYCNVIGCNIVALPWLSEQFRNAAALAELAPSLNAFGKTCADNGLTFAYHNHDFEFATDGGVYLLDALLGATDPALVQLELDVYWAQHAGVDPIRYLGEHAGRIALVHLKDRAPDGGFAEVGAGSLDMPAIIAAAEAAGAQWFIVENDAPTIPSLESAQRSLDWLTTHSDA